MMFIKTMNSILALVFLSMLLSCQANDQKNTSPNVLMISVDDLNDWIGILGAHPDVKTPNIDRLANDGILFVNAHCQAPICGPSRASIMSGFRPSTTGIYGQIKDENLRKGSKLMESVRFLPQYFKDHGYKTIGIGKIFTTMHRKESSRFLEEGLLVLVHARINQLSGVIKELQQIGVLIPSEIP